MPTAIDLPRPEMARLPLGSHLTGLSRSRLYQLAADGRIRFVKVGGATLVDMGSVRAFLATLPAAKIAPPRPKAAA